MGKSIVQRMIQARPIEAHPIITKSFLHEENMGKHLNFHLSKLHHVANDGIIWSLKVSTVL